MITLSGGPFDGQTRTFVNGDYLEIDDGPPILDFSVRTVEPFKITRHLYRRSMRDPNIFVFQP